MQTALISVVIAGLVAVTAETSALSQSSDRFALTCASRDDSPAAFTFQAVLVASDTPSLTFNNVEGLDIQIGDVFDNFNLTRLSPPRPEVVYFSIDSYSLPSRSGRSSFVSYWTFPVADGMRTAQVRGFISLSSQTEVLNRFTCNALRMDASQ